jgi:hypothetical protein
MDLRTPRTQTRNTTYVASSAERKATTPVTVERKKATRVLTLKKKLKPLTRKDRKLEPQATATGTTNISVACSMNKKRIKICD